MTTESRTCKSSVPTVRPRSTHTVAGRIESRPRPDFASDAEIESDGYVAVGCKYGVSDNAVRKWVRFYERQGEREEAEAAAERLDRVRSGA